MKPWAWVVAGGVLLFVLLSGVGAAALLWAVARQPPEPAARLTPASAVSRYRENGARFKQDFEGKWVELSGTVGGVPVILGTPVLVVESRDDGGVTREVRCRFADPSCLSGLRKGDGVRVVGVADCTYSGGPELTACVLVKYPGR